VINIGHGGGSCASILRYRLRSRPIALRCKGFPFGEIIEWTVSYIEDCR
jgi:hypothetical protein